MWLKPEKYSQVLNIQILVNVFIKCSTADLMIKNATILSYAEYFAVIGRQLSFLITRLALQVYLDFDFS